MTLGLSLAAFTILHVLISLAGIATGLIAVFGMFSGKVLKGWTGLFLATTILTSVTGLMFPFKGVTPAVVLAIISLFVLAIALIGLKTGRPRTYGIAATAAQYFNVFVLFNQIFDKVPSLKAIAPTPASPLLGGVQLVVLVVFLWFGVKVAKGMKV